MEALGIAGAFDLAVATKVITLVDQLPDVHVAFNVSAETIAKPASLGVLAGRLARRRRLAPRLLIEVTETGNIGDLIKIPPILADVGLGWLVWSMARELGAGHRAALIGACADDTCGWLFLDTTRNRTRRWCVMKECGNRSKVRRFRERAH